MKADPIILRMKYARIVELFARQANIKNEDALEKFYDSELYNLISQGVADMHCRSDEYLADELLIEYGYQIPTYGKQTQRKTTLNSNKRAEPDV